MLSNWEFDINYTEIFMITLKCISTLSRDRLDIYRETLKSQKQNEIKTGSLKNINF